MNAPDVTASAVAGEPDPAVAPRRSWRTTLFREAWPLLLAGLIVGTPVALARLRYGSFENLRAVLNGEVLLVDARTKSFGELGPEETGTVRFQLWNTSDRPVRILGGSTDCGCAVLKETFPLTIDAGGRTAVSLSVRPPEFGEYVGNAYLFTSAPGARSLKLRLDGKRKVEASRTP